VPRQQRGNQAGQTGRRRRRRNNNTNRVTTVAVPVAVPPMGRVGEGKRRRRRAARARRRAGGQVVPYASGFMSGANDPITSAFVSSDGTMDIKNSVHKALQNHFFPDAGIHRGLATGDGNTALAYIRGSLTVNAFTSTNNVMSFCFNPSNSATGVTLSLKYGSDLTNPLATPSATVPGVFSVTNPSTDYRCVHGSVRLIPSGSFTNQAGEGSIGYTTDLVTLSTNFTRANVDELNWSMPITGLTNDIAHWVPNTYETAFSANAYGKTSGIVGYLAVPSTSAANTQFRLEYTLGYEYLPNTVYRPFVNLMPPDMHPDTYYHVNKITRMLHYPLIVGTWEDYQAFASKFTPIPPVSNPGATSIGGFARDNMDRDPIMDEYQPGYLARGVRAAVGLAGAIVPSVGLYGQYNRVRRANRPLAIMGGGGYPAQMMARDLADYNIIG